MVGMQAPSHSLLLLAPLVVCDGALASTGSGALDAESEDLGMRAALPDAHHRVDLGSEAALLHTLKTGICRPRLEPPIPSWRGALSSERTRTHWMVVVLCYTSWRSS
jgi:hypothetical protein